MAYLRAMTRYNWSRCLVGYSCNQKGSPTLDKCQIYIILWPLKASESKLQETETALQNFKKYYCHLSQK